MTQHAEAPGGDEQQRPLAVVIGCNRGIGLGLCQELLKQGYEVLGTCRSSSQELEQLQGVQVVTGVDVTQEGAPGVVLQALAGRQVSLLVVCAGYQTLDSLANLDLGEVDKHWQINALAPLRMVLALHPAVADTRGKVALISSKMGSQGAEDLPKKGGLYGYRMSKTAVNMAGKLLAEDLAERGIAVGILHPGPVYTDMLRSLRTAKGVTDPQQQAVGTLSVEESCAKMVDYLQHTLDAGSSGVYWAADVGKPLPW